METVNEAINPREDGQRRISPEVLMRKFGVQAKNDKSNVNSSLLFQLKLCSRKGS
jgi:hypothetical protein